MGEGSQRRKSPKRFVAVCILAAGGAAFFLWWQPNRELSSQLEQCESAGLFEIDVRYGSPFSRNDVLFEIRDPHSSARKVDAVHVLLQFGYAIRDLTYKRLQLIADGRVAYVVNCADLSDLSQEYTHGNPVFSIRKWPSVLYTTGGSRAFDEWSGGILAVLTEEMEDVNEALDRWLFGR